MDVPADWARAVDRLLAGPTRPVAVLGPADAGKSSFCRLVLAHAALAGCPVALLDADLAQKMAGPPACVTRGHMGSVGMQVPDGLAFVGAVDPLRGWQGLLAGVAALAAEAPAGVLLANTDGLLHGAGRRLKAAALWAMQAELIVAIGADPRLEAVLGDHPGLPVLRLGASPRARRKSAGERRAIRQAGFRRYFAGATTWPAAPGELRVEQAMVTPAALPHRLLLGLEAADGRDLGLGLLAENGPSGAMTVLSPIGRALVAGLRCGRLALDAEFRDRPWRP